MRVPLGVFAERDSAVLWAQEERAAVSFAEYPVDQSLLRWSLQSRRDALVEGSDELSPASFVIAPMPLGVKPSHRKSPAKAPRPSRKMLWLWISHRPDRRPLPSAVFSSLERASSFIEEVSGTGAAFRCFVETVPGVGGRIDYVNGKRSTPTPKRELVAATSGLLRSLIEDLSDQDLSEAEAAAAELHEIVPLHRTWAGTFLRWLKLVTTIEHGYPDANLLFDYQHDLSSRTLIDRILQQVPDSTVRARLLSTITPLDERFFKETKVLAYSIDPLGGTVMSRDVV